MSPILPPWAIAWSELSKCNSYRLRTYLPLGRHSDEVRLPIVSPPRNSRNPSATHLPGGLHHVLYCFVGLWQTLLAHVVPLRFPFSCLDVVVGTLLPLLGLPRSIFSSLRSSPSIGRLKAPLTLLFPSSSYLLLFGYLVV